MLARHAILLPADPEASGPEVDSRVGFPRTIYDGSPPTAAKNSEDGAFRRKFPGGSVGFLVLGQVEEGVGETVHKVPGDQADLAVLVLGDVAGQAVDVNAQRGRLERR